MLDRVNLLLEETGDHYMHYVFELDGGIDVERFERALRLVMTAQPLMAQRIVRRWWAPQWEQLTEAELDRAAYCDIVEVADGLQRDDALQSYLVDLRDFSSGPLLHARVFRGAGSDVICMKVSCVPVDGRAFAYVIANVAAIYTELAADPGYRPAPGSLDDRSTLPLLRSLGPHLLRLPYLGIRNVVFDAVAARNWAIPMATDGSLARRYDAHLLSPEASANLQRFRADHGLSVNDVLLSAVYVALYELIQPERPAKFSISNTYDLRRYDGPDGPPRVGNYSSFICTNVEIDDDASLATVAQRVAAEMRARKSRLPGTPEVVLIGPLMKAMPYAIGRRILQRVVTQRSHTPTFTNVGKVPGDLLAFDGEVPAQMYAYAPLEYPPKLAITAITIGDDLSLSVAYSSNHLPREQVLGLFSRIEELLAKAA
jgi:NRPS condensation-like uncharacterized protein